MSVNLSPRASFDRVILRPAAYRIYAHNIFVSISWKWLLIDLRAIEQHMVVRWQWTNDNGYLLPTPTHTIESNETTLRLLHRKATQTKLNPMKISKAIKLFGVYFPLINVALSSLSSFTICHSDWDRKSIAKLFLLQAIFMRWMDGCVHLCL